MKLVLSARPAHSSTIGARRTGLALLCAAAALLAACNDDDDPAPVSSPPPDTKTPTTLAKGEDPPGVILEITAVSGMSGADGSARAGDVLSVQFTAKKRDGSRWTLNEFSTGRILLSGPTFNYQRVIPEQSDVVTRAVYNSDGSYTYTFASAIPAEYVAPINDTVRFGTGDGELTGQALLAGTYTVGLYLGWSYTYDGEPLRDSGDATKDFLFGGATTLVPRELVKADNCNQCHESLRAHSGLRRDTRSCVLCHTSGAEDNNNPDLAGGTPDVTIDFRVLIHKLHNGAHLPSVLGVATRPDGTRDYGATPKPYLVAGSRSVHDFSGVNFPVWPEGLIAMPRDYGYTALTAAQQTTDTTLRTGVTACYVCHGDPDGTGPLTAPAQGDVAHTQPSRRACASCHDDVDFTLPYTANQSTMPAQPDDSSCLLCHGPGGALAPEKVHLHPLRDPTVNPGLTFAVNAVAAAGNHNNDGTIDPGEKVAVTFTVTDGAGLPVNPTDVASVSAVLAGPTTNSNLVLNGSIPPAAITGTQPFTMRLPQTILIERVGQSSADLDTFQTAFTPHWDVNGAATSVMVLTGTGGGDTVLAAPAGPTQNYVDVVDATGFARNDYVAIDYDKDDVEYLRIQHVDGNRLWFSSPATTGYVPGLGRRHVLHAGVTEVTLATKTRGTHYTLDRASGRITETAEFGFEVDVLVSYTTDFVMPATFPLALNDGPSLDESNGKWTGKPVADGTYHLTMWGSRNITVAAFGETNAYRGTSLAATAETLVGSAQTLVPYELIESGASCNACHQEVLFHGGGRRGFDTCIACHGTAGSEDRPRYVAPNAPATNGVTITFRSMLHKIHMGEELTNASAYTLVGFGGAPHPNNFTAHTYEHIVFPALPGGVRSCTKCHGADNTAWMAPAERNHPAGQLRPTRAWMTACGSCHDSDAAGAHIDAQTPRNAAESCDVCHGAGKEWNVSLVHKAH